MSLDLRSFILQARVRQLYRSALRISRECPDVRRGEREREREVLPGRWTKADEELLRPAVCSVLSSPLAESWRKKSVVSSTSIEPHQGSVVAT
mmetsp:Transcript_16888/g.34997  ORF Transcript_16888/g.34997 Transcript_16888/m.34997 type:complete len:93 (+) Transcript_16888:476-754(+)